MLFNLCEKFTINKSMGVNYEDNRQEKGYLNDIVNCLRVIIDKISVLRDDAKEELAKIDQKTSLHLIDIKISVLL